MKRLSALILSLILICSFALAENPATPTDLCAHDNIENNIDYSYEYSQIPGNQDQHHVKCYYTNTRICSDCGEEISEETSLYDEYDDFHFYEGYDGKCSACGFVPNCYHDCTYEELTNTHDVTYKPYDSRTHLYEGYADISVFCDICHLLLKTKYNKPFTYSEDHNYDENSVCTICGYKSTCTHSHLIPQKEETNLVDCEYEDKTHHLLKHYVKQLYYCFECNLLVSESEEEYCEELAYHSFDNNNICYDCGYKREECSHSQVFYGLHPLYYDYNNTGNPERHTAYEHGEIVKECANCNKELERTPYIKEYTFRHFFDRNGICDDCGYVRQQSTEPCSHPRKDWYDCVSTCLEAEPLNETFHVYKTLTEYKYMCPDCNEIFSDEYRIEEGEITEKHNFYHGYCSSCGYSNQCTHPSTKNTSEIWFYETISSKTNKGHTLNKAIQVNRTICTQCNDILDSSETFFNGDYFEPHTYSKGVCTICGYKKSQESYTSTANAETTITAAEEYDDEIAQIIQALTEAVDQQTLNIYLPAKPYQEIRTADTLLIDPFVTTFNSSSTYGMATVTYKAEQKIEAGKDVIILLGWIHEKQLTWIVTKGKTGQDNIITFEIATKQLSEFGKDPVIVAILFESK